MIAAGSVPAWSRGHRYKALACVVLALVALQYLFSGILDRRAIETVFAANATRYSDHSYLGNRPRGLTIYGPAVARNATIANVSIGTTIGATDPSVAPSERENLTTSRENFAYPNATNTTKLPPWLRPCPLVPPNLIGPVHVFLSVPENAHATEPPSFARLRNGGAASPDECIARYRVAVVIPFRNRHEHLQILLYNLHPMLLRQQIDYQIFVVEQEGTGQFNRAMLMNVGYVEALKERSFDCFIFHDVDLLPEDDRNLYTCPEQPRHMSVAIDKFNYRLPYPDLFGGVSAMTTKDFGTVNGFSNVFFGWGAEDDDMANRIKAHGLHISRYPANIARYKMITHKKEKGNPRRFELLKTGKKRFSTDGLNNLQYELHDKRKLKLYTWILVRLIPPQPS